MLQVGKAIKKFFKGWKRRREIQDMQNENFALHIRKRRFISKIICEGLVGGGCKGQLKYCKVPFNPSTLKRDKCVLSSYHFICNLTKRL